MFQFWGLLALFGGLIHQSSPVATGLGLGLGQVLSNFLWSCTPSVFR